MTETFEALSRRMATLKSIRGVVRTMKTLSAVNAAPYEAAVRSIETYHATIIDGLHILLGIMGPPSPETKAGRMANRVGIMLVFGSDHGLCGGYNDGIADKAAAHIQDGTWQVLAIGAKMQAALLDRGIVCERCFQPPASAEGIGRLAGEILITLDAMRGGVSDHNSPVVMTYMAMNKGSGRAPVTVPLLPLDPVFLARLAAQPWRSHGLPIVTMNPGALFSALVRNHLFAGVFRAAAEAIATENAARLALMQQAERAIDERLDDLLKVTRSARQSAVTNELLDVIAGFEALKRA